MRSVWHTSPLPYDRSKELANTLGVSEILATVLGRRGYGDAESARRFLSAEGELHDPLLFPQMQAVCELVRNAISSHEKICIHGDYDVDGITAAALLVNVLKGLGADVSCHLPNRFTEGYGVSQAAVKKIAAAGASLLITVDCGITAADEIELALSLGLKTIVIDHHRPPEGGLPPGAIISPLLCDYPFKGLAGVGLAFKVAQALLDSSGEDGGGLPDELRRQLDLVALGTIADVVPLLGENRTLVKRGLVQMTRSRRPGLRALMNVSQMDPQKLSAGLVAFRLAPRINAAGRLDDPGPALELLLAEEEETAAGLAEQLDSLNKERQRIESQMLAEAEAMIKGWPEAARSANGYVLSSPGWHEGVIGIVASKIVDLYHRPVIMIAEKDSLAKGSGRSIPSFNLHEALLKLAHLLNTFGGHSAACGLSIEVERIEAFRQEFARLAKAISPEDLKPRRYVDALVTGRELTLDLAQELALMEPFGMGNPSVDLLAPGVQVKSSRKTRCGQHLQCRIESAGVTASAIGFRQASLFEKVGEHPEWDVIFKLEQNEFNGSVSPQLNLRHLIPRPAEEKTPPGLCACRCDYGCDDRLQGDDFWRLVDDETGARSAFLESIIGEAEALGPADHDPPGLALRLNDRRGWGDIPGQISRLAATGENLLLLVADVPRRRRLVSHSLPLANLDLGRVLLAGSRCGPEALSDRIKSADGHKPVVMLADFATALATPGLPSSFSHIVFIDPPLCRSLLDAVAAAAPRAWLHLFYCGDELQFTGKVLKHEFDLREALAKIYQHLRTEKVHPLNETTERLLLAGGKYLRQPTLVARCLKVLRDLALVSVEEGDGKKILILPEIGKTELTGSPTYRAVTSFYEGCQKYLNKSLNEKLI